MSVLRLSHLWHNTVWIPEDSFAKSVFSYCVAPKDGTQVGRPGSRQLYWKSPPLSHQYLLEAILLQSCLKPDFLHLHEESDASSRLGLVKSKSL